MAHLPADHGIGSSPTARFYSICSLEEAQAYLAHPVLGQRLCACVEALQDLGSTTAEVVFGSIEAMKLRSSLTLFIAAGGHPMFLAALERWFGGKADEATLQRLSLNGPSV